MGLDTRELTVAAFIEGDEHALVVAKRAFDGRIKILGAYKGPVVAPVINDMLKYHKRLFEGTERNDLQGVAGDTANIDGLLPFIRSSTSSVGLFWIKMYKKMSECRAVLGALLTEQGDVSGKLNGDDMVAGGDIMRDAVRTGEGPLFDALAVAVALIDSRFPEGGRQGPYRRERILKDW